MLRVITRFMIIAMVVSAMEGTEEFEEEEEEWVAPWFLNKWPRTFWEYYDFT